MRSKQTEQFESPGVKRRPFVITIDQTSCKRQVTDSNVQHILKFPTKKLREENYKKITQVVLNLCVSYKNVNEDYPFPAPPTISHNQSSLFASSHPPNQPAQHHCHQHHHGDSKIIEVRVYSRVAPSNHTTLSQNSSSPFLLASIKSVLDNIRNQRLEMLLPVSICMSQLEDGSQLEMLLEYRNVGVGYVDVAVDVDNCYHGDVDGGLMVDGANTAAQSMSSSSSSSSSSFSSSSSPSSSPSLPSIPSQTTSTRRQSSSSSSPSNITDVNKKTDGYDDDVGDSKDGDEYENYGDDDDDDYNDDDDVKKDFNLKNDVLRVNETGNYVERLKMNSSFKNTYGVSFLVITVEE